MTSRVLLLFRQSSGLWENVEKYYRAGQATVAIWRMRTACWIPKATDTHSEYVILIAFSQQQWWHESASCYVPRTSVYCYFVCKTFLCPLTICNAFPSAKISKCRTISIDIWHKILCLTGSTVKAKLLTVCNTERVDGRVLHTDCGGSRYIRNVQIHQ
jgi:hypothetical protein